MTPSARSNRKHAHPRIAMLRAKHADALRALAIRTDRRRRLHSGPAAFDLLAAADPTTNGMYVQAIVYWALGGKMRLEDARQVRATLSDFHARKRSLPVAKRDINAYAAPGDIAAMLDEELSRAVGIDIDIEMDGQEVIAKGEAWVLVRLTSVAAARAWAKDTRWCTASSSTATEYLESGPLHVVATPTHKYQFHLPTNQFLDLHDVVPTQLMLPDAALDAVHAELLKPPLEALKYHDVTLAGWIEPFRLPPQPSVRRYGVGRFYQRSIDGRLQFCLSPSGPMHFCVVDLSTHQIVFVPPDWKEIDLTYRADCEAFLRYHVRSELVVALVSSLHVGTHVVFPDSKVAMMVGSPKDGTVVVHGDAVTGEPVAIVVREKNCVDATIYDLTGDLTHTYSIRSREDFTSLPPRMRKAFQVVNARTMQDFHLAGMIPAMAFGCDCIDPSLWEEMDWIYRLTILNRVDASSPLATRESLDELLEHLIPDMETARSMAVHPTPPWTHAFQRWRASGSGSRPRIPMDLTILRHTIPAATVQPHAF